MSSHQEHLIFVFSEMAAVVQNPAGQGAAGGAGQGEGQGNRRFACTLCPVTFSDRGTLHRHLKEVHGVGNTPVHTCTLCPPGKDFKRAWGLKKHKETVHRQGIPRSCPNPCSSKSHHQGDSLVIIHKRKYTLCYTSVFYLLVEALRPSL